MTLLDRATPEDRLVAERRYTIEVEIAELESEIDTRRDNPLEVETLLRRVHELERRKDALRRPRLRRITPEPLLALRAA